MRHPHHPFSSTTTDPTAERGRTRRRRGDFPDAPYEEGFDPRRGGPRGAFPHEHHEAGTAASAPAARAASAVPASALAAAAAVPAGAPDAVTSAPRSCCSSPRSRCTATS